MNRVHGAIPEVAIKVGCNKVEWEEMLRLRAESGLEESFPNDAGHVLALVGGKVAGYCEFIMTGQQATVLEFVVAHGSNVGLRLGRAALGEMKGRGATYCVMACKRHLVGYFTKFDFQVIGYSSFYYPSGEPAVIMGSDLGAYLPREVAGT